MEARLALGLRRWCNCTGCQSKGAPTELNCAPFLVPIGSKRLTSLKQNPTSTKDLLCAPHQSSSIPRHATSMETTNSCARASCPPARHAPHAAPPPHWVSAAFPSGCSQRASEQGQSATCPWRARLWWLPTKKALSLHQRSSLAPSCHMLSDE